MDEDALNAILVCISISTTIACLITWILFIGMCIYHRRHVSKRAKNQSMKGGETISDVFALDDILEEENGFLDNEEAALKRYKDTEDPLDQLGRQPSPTSIHYCWKYRPHLQSP